MKITYKQRDDDFDDVVTYAKRNYLSWLHFWWELWTDD